MVLENCVGTVNYMSPEVLQGVGSKAVDSKVHSASPNTVT